MYLQRLSLIDFKNVGEAQIELSPQINCMVGDNGTGKTNLLDAVHYLSMCKSAFGLSDTQCVRHGSEAFLVDGRYGEPATDRTERIVCSFKKGGQKKLCRNGKEYEKLSDHIGLIPLVLVTPSDTALINESGEERRKYLNSFISQLDREYLSALVRYNRLLAERNKLLKRQQSPGFEELIEVFDAQLCPLAATLWQKRKELVSELAPVVAGYYAALSGDRERVGLGYRSELNERPMDRILRETAQRDRINQFTSGGVHRDDMLMSIGDYPLRKYGSQGQQKSFLVALKLAQYDIVAARCGSRADPAAGRHIRQARPTTGRRADPHRSRQAVRPDTDYGLQPNAARRHIARKRVRVQAVPGIRRNRGGIMRRRDPVRIGDALNDFFSSTPVIARKIAEAKIPDLWPVLVGNVIASYTTKIELRTGGRLFVHLSSSVARNEVFMRRSALMDAINEASGIRIVSSVIVK